jgi:hypothetical protein
MTASRVRALGNGFFFSLACCALLVPPGISACGQTQGDRGEERDRPGAFSARWRCSITTAFSRVR